MASLIMLPRELLENILEYLAFSTTPNMCGKVLGNLSLTHSTLRPYAQARIFYRINLDFSRYSDNDWLRPRITVMGSPARSAALSRILHTSPHIGTYIKDLNIQEGALLHQSTIDVISGLSSVKALCITAPYVVEGNSDRAKEKMYRWDKIKVCGALVDKIFPTISTLTVIHFPLFPFHEVIPLCPNLENLTSFGNPDNASDLPLGQISPTIPFPPLKTLSIYEKNDYSQSLLRVIERARSTLNGLRLHSHSGHQGGTGMAYLQEVMCLIGRNLTSLSLDIRPELYSNEFHLSSLPSLKMLKLESSILFLTQDTDAALQWAILSFSVGGTHNHPLSELSVNFWTFPPVEPASPISADLWLQLDDTLASFSYLTRLWLNVTYFNESLEELMNAWGKQEVFPSTLFPKLAKRNITYVTKQKL
ncbi:hypothetical protein DL96DRAFT_1626591 [Flagelloscypha sp. PMI_526]|nr:hypothetical protein DL96DRAFT_1626591 [Flagelloscypha sp. PMI_526]